MKYIAIVIIFMVLFSMFIPIYAENEQNSKYDSLKLRHATNPYVCLFEVNPELYDDWYKLKYITIDAIEEWILKLEYTYPNGDWSVLVETKEHNYYCFRR